MRHDIAQQEVTTGLKGRLKLDCPRCSPIAVSATPSVRNKIGCGALHLAAQLHGQNRARSTGTSISPTGSFLRPAFRRGRSPASSVIAFSGRRATPIGSLVSNRCRPSNWYATATFIFPLRSVARCLKVCGRCRFRPSSGRSAPSTVSMTNGETPARSLSSSRSPTSR